MGSRGNIPGSLNPFLGGVILREVLNVAQIAVLQIARFGVIGICDSNRESQLTSDLKSSALRFCCDLKKTSNHKSRDLNCDLKRF